ncbi:MAG: anchored repeat ABC transporter, substrate-binding protein [Propionibacteriaceae bacterium]|nr:anchored repeat ABC transporter, substrate-binding protein [Propionibacteriaceae bacterium]
MIGRRPDAGWDAGQGNAQDSGRKADPGHVGQEPAGQGSGPVSVRSKTGRARRGRGSAPPGPRPGGRATRRARSVAVAVFSGALLLSGCASPPILTAGSDRLQVVTTTGLLRDLVSQVGGDRVDVVSIVPDGADPHTWEPTLRDSRDVVYADVAFSNYALLEEHNIIRTLDANLRPEAVQVSLAEEAVKYAAEIIPLVENVNLDTVWLGLRARGDGAARYGADRASQVLLSATAATGPGEVFAYLTGTFGDTEVYFDSSDGFDSSNGYRDDTVALPPDAHTHLSWAFTQPGVYTITLAARIQVDDTARPQELGQATFTFAVGVSPAAAGRPGAVILNQGHADLTANLDDGGLEVRYDPAGGGEHGQTAHRPDQVVIEVPAKAQSEIPGGGQFAFLGRPGQPIYQLPQAVLGQHVHGEIDPHLWQDVRNAMAYVNLIRDTLIGVDPAGARAYVANASAYLARLEETDDYVRATIATIPEANRYLITTHDAFGYLAHAYDLRIAGFVTPNPASEPSLADRRKLSQTLRTLGVPAVFLEPNQIARSSVLTELAAEQGVAVCRIYGDSFDDRVRGYIEMMRFNADSLRSCLGG